MTTNFLRVGSARLSVASREACLTLAASLALLACDGSSGGGSGGGGLPAPLQADFGANTTFGERPIEIQFLNTTQGKASDWNWNFGDGATSNLKQPRHTFTRPGNYSVELTASGPSGVSTLVRPRFVNVTAAPADIGFEAGAPGSAPTAAWESFFGAQGNFGHTLHSAAGGADGGMPTEGALWAELGADSTSDTLPPREGGGETPRTGAGVAQEFSFPAGRGVLQFDVVFVNAEGGAAPNANDWLSVDISDRTTTRNLLRRDTFSPIAGTSTLHGGLPVGAVETVTADLELLFPGSNFATGFTLTAQVGNGANGTLPSRAYVDHLRFEAPAAPLACDFVAVPTQIVETQSVAFFAQTPGASAWAWDFGDGFGSNLENPVHVYGQAGVYDVTLRATAPGTQGVMQKLDHVVVIAAQGTVDFDGQPRKVAVNLPVSFLNLSNGTFNGAWLWQFGDGTTSTASGIGQALQHAYTTLGKKTVRLNGTLVNGQPVSLAKTDFIDVQQPVSISSHPQSLSVNQGQAAQFTVVANGTAPLHFEWRRNNVPITGAPDQATFTIPATTPADNGARFRALVTNDVSSSLSNEAVLTVVLIPVITQHPQPTTVPVGAQAAFSVNHTGTPPFTYTWRKNGVAIPGAPNLPNFTTAPVSAANNGELYSVRVANAAGAVISNDALLTVSSAPVITVQPQPQTVCSGNAALYTVTATGTAPLSFQWRRNGVNIPGATNSSFTTPATVPGDNGALFSVVVSNIVGNTPSNDALLTVRTFPTTSNPSNQTVCSGSPASFQVTGGGGGLSFLWFRNGSQINGATSSVLNLATTAPGDSGSTFFCRVSNACGSVNSGNATLTVNTAPAITVQPQATLFVVEGGQAQFSVTASGSSPLSFQWRRNGIDINGATSNVLTLNSVGFGDDGVSFSCRVSNACNTAGVTSASGVLQVAKRWSTIWTGTINPKCASCHGNPGSAGLTLSGDAATAYSFLVNVPTNTSNTCLPATRVVQFNPGASSLVSVITGAPTCVSQDHGLITSPLTAGEITDIQECIRAGIPNN